MELIKQHLPTMDELKSKRRVERQPWMQHDLAASSSNAQRLGRRFFGEGFIYGQNNRFAYTNAFAWLFSQECMQAIDPTTDNVIKGDLSKGLYIFGGVGTGKTTLIDFIGSLSKAYGISFASDELVVGMSSEALHAGEVVDSYVRGDETYVRLKRRPIVIINDLGTEPLEALYMGNRQNVLASILEARGDRPELLTIITSNIPICAPKGNQSIQTLYGDRVASRLREMCNYLPLFGDDLRGRRYQPPPITSLSRAK